MPKGVHITRIPFGGYDSNKIADKWARKIQNRARAKQLKQETTAIVDSGAMEIYLQPGAPVENVNPNAPQIQVGTASGQPHKSKATSNLRVPTPKGKPPLEGHIIPGFKHNLVGVGKFCDEDCQVHFFKESVIIYDPDMVPLIAGW